MSGKKQTFIQIIRKVPTERKPMAKKLLENITFMDETLDKLQEIVQEKGGVELFEQGKQKFMRENPALKSYNATIKQRNATYSQLLALVPKETGAAGEEDGFEAFVEGRGD